MTASIDNCTFCKIIRNEAESEKIYEDDQVVCIKDISPASTHHYLIIPKQHIPNAKELKKSDLEIYKKVISMVGVISEQQNLDLKSVRTGFHWPPFNSINHLHLHVISPIESMSFVKRMMFKPDSMWFVSIDYVMSYLEKQE